MNPAGTRTPAVPSECAAMQNDWTDGMKINVLFLISIVGLTMIAPNAVNAQRLGPVCTREKLAYDELMGAKAFIVSPVDGWCLSLTRNNVQQAIADGMNRCRTDGKRGCKVMESDTGRIANPGPAISNVGAQSLTAACTKLYRDYTQKSGPKAFAISVDSRNCGYAVDPRRGDVVARALAACYRMNAAGCKIMTSSSR